MNMDIWLNDAVWCSSMPSYLLVPDDSPTFGSCHSSLVAPSILVYTSLPIWRSAWAIINNLLLGLSSVVVRETSLPVSNGHRHNPVAIFAWSRRASNDAVWLATSITQNNWYKSRCLPGPLEFLSPFPELSRLWNWISRGRWKRIIYIVIKTMNMSQDELH